MSFKTWLLTGTSIGLMAVAPLPANAQGAELQSAIQSFLQAQASGDAAALEAAQSTLTNECIVAGFASVDECLASGGSAPAAPAVDNSAAEAEAAAAAEAQAAAEAEQRAAAEAEAQAAAEAEAAAAQAAAEEQARQEAEAAASEAEAQAAAEAEARAAAEQQAADEAAAAAAAREQEEAAARAAAEAEAAAQAQAEAEAAAAAQAEQAAPEEQPAEQPAPAPEAAPAPETPAAPEVAPAPAPEAQPAVPEAAPAPTPEAQPAAPAPAPEAQPTAPSVDYQAEFTRLVTDYETAISDLLNGANADEVNQRLATIRAEISGLCADQGTSDVASCLATYGLALPEVPGMVATPPVEQPTEQPVAEPEVPVEQPAPVEETTSDGQAAEPITELPAGIEAEQIAPLLDSAKDEPIEVTPVTEPVEGQPAAEAPVVLEPTIVTIENLPTDDQAAQSEEIRAMVAAPLAADEAGTVVTAVDNTTVNQTIVNNYVTNIVNNVGGETNITNNTAITNNQNTTNIGQQNNLQNNYVQIVEAPVLQPTSTGDAIAQVILQVGTQLIVNSIGQDTNRFYNPQQDEIYYENLSNGRTREVITRPDGTQVITVRNRNGDILRRSRITPDDREYVLAYFDDRYENNLNTWRDPGLDLPPLRLNIPARDYVLDARYADDRQLTTFFAQPPVEQVARLYSIDEVKRSARVRDSVRKLEVGNLTFDTAAATIGRDQVGSLQSVANAMLALLRTNPNETFLIEGHSDAVGSDIANLRLSDARAATVARVLSDFYGVPPENLATQGYGERYLKIRTEAAERENRRVTIRRITPLVTVANR